MHNKRATKEGWRVLVLLLRKTRNLSLRINLLCPVPLCNCYKYVHQHSKQGRTFLFIQSVNGLHQVKPYLQRYDGDATKVPISLELRRTMPKELEKVRDDTQGLQLEGTHSEPDVSSEQH